MNSARHSAGVPAGCLSVGPCASVAAFLSAVLTLVSHKQLPGESSVLRRWVTGS